MRTGPCLPLTLGSDAPKVLSTCNGHVQAAGATGHALGAAQPRAWSCSRGAGCHEAPGTSLHTDALRQSSPGLVMPALGLWAGCWAQPLAMTPEQPARGSNAHFRDTNAEAWNGQLTLSPGAV